MERERRSLEIEDSREGFSRKEGDETFGRQKSIFFFHFRSMIIDLVVRIHERTYMDSYISSPPPQL